MLAAIGAAAEGAGGLRSQMEPISLENQEALKAHPYYRARLDHLESQNPRALLTHLENGTLSNHLLETADRAVQTEGNLVAKEKMEPESARELVMNQVVADPEEESNLNSLDQSRMTNLLQKWKRSQE
jgi:hypothetical protein